MLLICFVLLVASSCFLVELKIGKLLVALVRRLRCTVFSQHGSKKKCGRNRVLQRHGLRLDSPFTKARRSTGKTGLSCRYSGRRKRNSKRKLVSKSGGAAALTLSSKVAARVIKCGFADLDFGLDFPPQKRATIPPRLKDSRHWQGWHSTRATF